MSMYFKTLALKFSGMQKMNTFYSEGLLYWSLSSMHSEANGLEKRHLWWHHVFADGTVTVSRALNSPRLHSWGFSANIQSVAFTTEYPIILLKGVLLFGGVEVEGDVGCGEKLPLDSIWYNTKCTGLGVSLPLLNLPPLESNFFQHVRV